MQSVNPVLPVVGFAEAQLLPPRSGDRRVLFARRSRRRRRSNASRSTTRSGACSPNPSVADGDYPAAPRVVNGRLRGCARATPGEFAIVGDVRMGHNPQAVITAETARRIPTGGVLPEGADAVVPIEDARAIENELVVDAPIAPGTNVAATRRRYAARRSRHSVRVGGFAAATSACSRRSA